MASSSVQKQTGGLSYPAHLFDYRADIDGLRGIAVIAVILFHLNKRWLPSGFTGVDIFFVISGYVVTASLLKHETREIKSYLLQFYSRRIKRILPNLIACILITALLMGLLVPSTVASKMYESGISALFGYSNLHFNQLTKNYFSPAQELNPFLQTWSLGVEEQFYLVYPILILIGSKIKRIRAFPIILFFSFLSLGICFHLTSIQPKAAYYLMPSRFWELASGGLLFFILLKYHELVKQLAQWKLVAIQFISGSLILSGLLFIPNRQGFPFPGALLSVLGTLGIIAIATHENSFLRKLLSHSGIVRIGQLSYSLYLWHWSILTLFRWTLGLYQTWTQLLAIGLILIFSVSSYYLVEQPCRTLTIQRSWKILLVGILSLFIALININLIRASTVALFLDKSSIPNSPVGWESTQCHLDKFEPEAARNCLALSKEDSQRRFYLIGDSHAGSLFDMLRAGETELGYSLKTLTVGFGCSYLPKSMLDEVVEQSTHCRNYGSFIRKELVGALKPKDVVVLAIFRTHLMPHEYRDIENFSTLNNLEKQQIINSQASASNELTKHVNELSQLVTKKGGTVILVGDVPLMKQEPQFCSTKTWWRTKSASCVVPREESQLQALPLTRAFQQSVQDNKRVFFWNPHDLLCDREACSPRLNGLPIFLDTHHLSQQGSQFLYPYFKRWLKQEEIL